MNDYQHSELAAGRWHSFTLAFQLANVGSEISRLLNWIDRDPALAERALVRGLELIDLTLVDPRWGLSTLREVTRARELLVGGWYAKESGRGDIEWLNRYFSEFAVVPR